MFVCCSESQSAGHVWVFRSSWEEMTESVPPVLRSSSWGLMCPCSTITSRVLLEAFPADCLGGGKAETRLLRPAVCLCAPAGVILTPWLLGGIGTLLYQLRVLDEAFAGVVPVCSCWVSVPPFRDWHGLWHTGPEWCKGCLLPITSLQMRRRWSLLTVWLLKRYILWCLGRSLWVM